MQTLPTLLDRDWELGRLDDLLGDAEREGGRLLTIESPPGIGKTSLLAEAKRRAAARGFTVIDARASELEQSFAFGVVHQLLDCELSDGQTRHELMAGAGALAEPVFAHRQGSAPPGDPSYPVLHGLYWMVSNLAQRRPLLLAVDDAQWADGPSIRFIQFLSRRLEGGQIAVAVAAREPGTDIGGELVLDSWPAAAELSGEALRPQALAEEAVRSIVVAQLGLAADDLLSRACAEATGGNPFLLEELLHDLRSRAATGEVLTPQAIETTGPASVGSVLLGRVRRIAGAEEVARALAILGDGAELSAVAELAEKDPGEVARIADALAGASILERPRPLGFTHPIVRVAIYAAIAPAERGAMHLRAARQASDRAAPSAVVANHLLRATPRGDPQVVARLRGQAEVALRSGAPESAVALLRRALTEPPKQEDLPAVQFELGAVLAGTGSREAVEHLDQAADLSPEATTRANIAVVLADVHQHSGDLERAVRVLEQGLDQLPPQQAALAARLEGRLLPLACTGVSGRRLAGPRLRAAADGLAAMAPEHARVVSASLAFDLVTGEKSDAAAAAAMAARSLQDGALLGIDTPDPVFAIGAVNALFLSGRYSESEPAFETLIGNAQRKGSAIEFALFSAMRSWSSYLQGSLQRAESDARTCLELSVETSWFVLNPLSASILAGVWLERGDVAKASEVVTPLDAIQGDDDIGFSQLLHISRARMLLGTGDAEGALEALAACGRFERAWGKNPGIASVVPWRSTMALALLASEDPAGALNLAVEQLDLARRFGAARPIGEALCTLARIEGGKPAIALLEEATETLDGSGAALEHGRALVELGAALRRASRRTDARKRLSAGVDLAYKAGASALAARGRDELVAAGARPRRLAASGPDSLTASERRVAEMASTGMTNREIAQALFVTLRTVESHLTNVFRKLDISSRAELGEAFDAADAK